MSYKKLFPITLLFFSALASGDNNSIFETMDREEDTFLETIKREQTDIKHSKEKRKKESKPKNEAGTAKEQNKAEQSDEQNLTKADDSNASNMSLLEVEKVRDVQVNYSRPLAIEVDLSDQTVKVSQDEKTLYKWKASTGRKSFPTPKGKFKPEFFKKSDKNDLTKETTMHYAIFFHESHAIMATQSEETLGNNSSLVGGVKLHRDNAKILFDLVVKIGAENSTIEVIP